MNILIVNTYHYYRAGAERLALDTGSLLSNRGHTVHYFSMTHPDNSVCYDEKYFVSNIDYRSMIKTKSAIDIIRAITRSIYSFEAQKKVRLLINKYDFDVVHLHSIRHHLTKSILPVFKEKNVPVIWTLHDYKELCPNTTFFNGVDICEKCKVKKYHNIVRYKCKKNSFGASIITYFEALVNGLSVYDKYISAYTSPSIFLRDKFIEFGYPASKIIHFPNFLDTDIFTPSYNPSGHLLFLGRIEKEKGILTLVNAFRAISAEFPKLKLKIAGTGTYDDDLRKLIKKKSLRNIEQLGFVSGISLEKLTKGASAIVIPSEWYENYPYSGLEAMAYGIPLIGSRIGGIPEIIDDNVTGFLFDPFSVEDLSEKLKLFINISTSGKKTMAVNSRQKVERINNPNIYYTRLLEIYDQLLK